MPGLQGEIDVLRAVPTPLESDNLLKKYIYARISRLAVCGEIASNLWLFGNFGGLCQ
jgi:hypothetical protein